MGNKWQLHDFFQPTKPLTDAELLEHRAEITNRRPALPSQAGKALRTIDAIAPAWAVHEARRAAAPVVISKRRPGDPQQRVSVRSVVVPEIDLDAMAKLLVDIARDWSEPKTGPQSGVEDKLTGEWHQDPDQESAA